MNSRRAPPDLERLQPLEAPDAVVLVDHEVPDLAGRGSRRGSRAPRARAARVEVDLLREDVAVGEDLQAVRRAARSRAKARRSGLRPAPARPRRGRPLAGLRSGAPRGPGVPRRITVRPGARPEVGHQPPQVSRVAAHGTAGDVRAPALGVDLAQVQGGRRRGAARPAPPAPTSASCRRRGAARRRAGRAPPRARACRASGLLQDRLGLQGHHVPPSRCSQGGTVAPGTSGDQVRQPRPRPGRARGAPGAAASAAVAGKALGQEPRAARGHRARRERVGERAAPRAPPPRPWCAGSRGRSCAGCRGCRP